MTSPQGRGHTLSSYVLRQTCFCIRNNCLVLTIKNIAKVYNVFYAICLQGHGGFSGYIMSMYVQYLLSQKKLNTFMSSYQVFRNTLLRLSRFSCLLFTKSKSLDADCGFDLCSFCMDQIHTILSHLPRKVEHKKPIKYQLQM